jgi:hypothetical protein
MSVFFVMYFIGIFIALGLVAGSDAVHNKNSKNILWAYIPCVLSWYIVGFAFGCLIEEINQKFGSDN